MRLNPTLFLSFLLCTLASCSEGGTPTDSLAVTSFAGANLMVQGEVTWMGAPLPALKNRGHILFQDPVSRELQSAELDPEGKAHFRLNVVRGVSYEVWWERGGSSGAASLAEPLPYGLQRLTTRSFDRSETLRLDLTGKTITLTGTIPESAREGWLHIAFGSMLGGTNLALGAHIVGTNFSIPLLAGTYRPWAAHINGGALPLCPPEGCAFLEDGIFAFTLPSTPPPATPKGTLTGRVTLRSTSARTLKGATISASARPPRIGQPPYAWLGGAYFARLTEAGTFAFDAIDQGVYSLTLDGQGTAALMGRYPFTEPAFVASEPASWQGQATSREVTIRTRINGAELPSIPVSQDERTAYVSSDEGVAGFNLPARGPWLQTFELLRGTYALTATTHEWVGRTHLRALSQKVLPNGWVRLAPFRVDEALSGGHQEVLFDFEVAKLTFSFAESFASAVGGRETVLVLYETQDRAALWHPNLLARQGQMLVYRGCYMPVLWRVHAGHSEPQAPDLLRSYAVNGRFSSPGDAVPLSTTPICVGQRDIKVTWNP